MALNFPGRLTWSVANLTVPTALYGVESLWHTGKMAGNVIAQTGRSLLHVLNNPGHFFKKAHRKNTKEQYGTIMTQYKKELKEDTATRTAPFRGDRSNGSFWSKVVAGTVHGTTWAVWNTIKTVLDTARRIPATLPVRTTNIFRKKENRVHLRKDGRSKNMNKRRKENYIGGFKQLKK